MRITACDDSTLDKLQDNYKPCVVFCHGNSEDIGSGQFGCQAFCNFLSTECHCNVISFDYPNYGHSCSVATTETNVCRAIDIVLEYVEKVLLAKNIFLYGKSIGSVPALHAAMQDNKPYKGIFLHSPLASAARASFLRTILPKFVLQKCEHMYLNNIMRIDNVKCPTAIIHGKQDEIIHFNNAIVLWNNCPNKFDELVLLGSDICPAKHNNIEYEYSTNLLDLLQHLIKQNSITHQQSI